ncbi:MAG: L,D-transpeptidase family protein [Streptosporangiales bacterium]|nr:L,D-transpeptidase family protein [Streptosporangiales bacterium]
MRPGDRGRAVRTLQKRLAELHYDPGRVDARFGPATQHAVVGFQKVNELSPDGVIGPKTRRALRDPEVPKPLVPKGPDERVEIDLDHQVLRLYQDGELRLISTISSGSGEYYCSEGRCRYATTPAGNFRAYRRVSGWDRSPLGVLYNPIYFNGGIAVQGSPSVPTYPASHGCVRIPMHTAEIFPDLVKRHERFYVRD